MDLYWPQSSMGLPCLSNSEGFIYLYVDRGIVVTPAPVSSLHFRPFGLLPVALPIQLVGNISVFVNARWLLVFLVSWTFGHPMALLVVLLSDYKCMETIYGMSCLGVVSRISFSSGTWWIFVFFFLFPVNLADWLFDLSSFCFVFCIFFCKLLHSKQSL